MTAFCENQTFEVELCCNCGIPFAMTADYQRRRRNDHAMFYCPAGHPQYYAGKTEAQKLKEQLEKRERELQRQQQRAVAAEGRAKEKEKQYTRIRARIQAGVCPCCNRTFENVARHMATQHTETDSAERLKHLRTMFGLTQADLAAEIGLSGQSISQYENHKVSEGTYTAQTINAWIEAQTGVTS